MASTPSSDRLYVGLREGRVVSFDTTNPTTITEFIDLTDRAATVWEGGLLGLALHPEFGTASSPHRNSVYIYYSSHCPLDASRDKPDLTACVTYPTDQVLGFYDVYLRLSRFEASADGLTAAPSSEQVLFNIELHGSSHRGGGLAFGGDGYLYLGIGDQFKRDDAQSIDDNFNGGAFRFAVDVADAGGGAWTCPAGSHMAPKTFDSATEISGQWYCVPDDNPWLDPTGGVFEEYCAIGLRNPFRLTADPLNGRIWSGDVGEASREEINVIVCGNNYGWPFREGLIEGVHPEPPSYLGVLTDPVIDFVRDEARALIGGYVYRGDTFPELYGRYLAGDYVTRRIWAVELDENTMTATKVHLTDYWEGLLGTWGQDRDGEVYIGNVEGTSPLHTLTRVGEPPPDAPATLSATGAFANIGDAEPASYWVPYGLNQPFWSDGARKTRFIALPNDGLRDTAAEQVVFSATGDWQFPEGTVLMKHFELPTDETNPAQTTRLETRFIVHGEDGDWYGVTYRWRPDQTDADLVSTEQSADYTITLAGGGTRTQRWLFPSRADCLRCHNNPGGGALGLRTHQLNGEFTYPSDGQTQNQLLAWSGQGMFDQTLAPASVASMAAAPAFDDPGAPLQHRARSWLDSNCGYCHRPGGANAGFDARFTTPFENQDLVDTPVRDDLGRPGTVVLKEGDPVLSALWQRAAAVGPIAMPPLAKALPQQPAVDVLGAWITSLGPAMPDGGTDSGMPDAGPGDAGLPDSGTPDSGAPDAGGPDAAIDDAGAPDAQADGGTLPPVVRCSVGQNRVGGVRCLGCFGSLLVGALLFRRRRVDRCVRDRV